MSQQLSQVNEVAVDTYRYAIIRFDLYHRSGTLEGVFVSRDFAQKYLDALKRKALDPSTFFNASKAQFKLFEVASESGSQPSLSE